MILMTQEEIERADSSLFTKIRQVKRTPIQDVHTNYGFNDPADQNEEPLD